MATRAAELLGRVREALGGRYTIAREIGRGGMAIVYLARDEKHDRDVAIKLLRPEVAVHLGVERFLREIQIEARLQHPHILPLHDSGVAAGIPYYVMPFVQGESLRDRLVREGSLAVPDALAITREVADALDYAHGQGVIHRDIKPENILLSEGHAVVADFGIARAASLAGSVDISTSGLVIGTPAYTSPEQAMAADEVDGRADLYSLACVTYEMLAGEPPFTGPTPQAIASRRATEPPRPLRGVRRSVPPAVERAVLRALAVTPADRYPSTREFVAALAEPDTDRHSRWLAAAAVLALVGGFLAYLAWPAAGASLDRSRYILAALPGSTSTADSQTLWAYEMESILRRVPDITLQDSPSVIDRVLQEGGPPDLSGWLDIARDFGAGHALAFRTVPVGDSIEVVVSVYDVARGSSVRSQSVRLAAAAVDVSGELGRLVERLFALPAGAVSGSTSSVDEASRAYAAGRKALQTWDLVQAAEWFRRAVQIDPEFGMAHLWLAKAGAWADTPTEDWIGSARRAASGAAQLDPRAQGMARALLALAEDRQAQACAEFERLVAADSLSFEAWYGLGECHRRDEAVLRDSASPSGWRFRSSYHTAMNAYQRALEIAPSFSFPAFARLPAVLFAEGASLRPGRALPPDTGAFRAFPALVADTIAFVPYPLAAVRAGDPGVVPPSLASAVASNRRRLLGTATAWSRAFPDSARAVRELARTLELTGRLEGPAPDEWALGTADRALQLARTEVDSIAATVIRIRVRLKLARFAAAAGVADSALAQWAAPPPEVALQLASAAALLGRPARSARLAARGAAALLANDPTGQTEGLAPAMVEAWKAFEGYAAVGGPADSLRALAGELATLAAATAPARLGRWNCQVWPVLLSWSYPELGRVAPREGCGPAPQPLLRMQAALARGDLAAVRAVAAAQAALRRDLLAPGDQAAHGVFHEAWVTVAAGDTAGAIAQLDGLLGALASIRLDLLDDPAQAGSLPRAMALRAELAAARGDRPTAARWAGAAVALWREGEAAVQPAVRRLTPLLQN